MGEECIPSNLNRHKVEKATKLGQFFIELCDISNPVFMRKGLDDDDDDERRWKW